MLQKVKEYFKIASNTGFFYIMTSNILNNLLMFLSGIFLVRIISKGDYGIYSYAYNLLSYFIIFSGFGMISGTFQLCCENNNNKSLMHSIYRYGFRWSVIINVILGIIIVLYSCLVPVPIQGAERYLIFLAFIPLANITFELAGIYFRSVYRNKEYAIMQTLSAVFVSVISVLGAYKLDAYGIILANYLGPLLSLLYPLCCTDWKEQRNSSALERKYKGDIWRISLVSMVNNSISQLLYLIDVSMIGEYIKNEEVIASYRIGMTIPFALNFIPMAIITYIYPYFASHIDDVQWTKRMVKKLIPATGVFFCVLSIGMFFLADLIVPMVFGAQYRDAIPVFKILCVSFFFQATFRTIFGNLLVTQRKLKFNMIAGILTGIVNIIGDFVLIRRYGAVGVAIATLIVMVFSGALHATYYLVTLEKKDRRQQETLKQESIDEDA